MQWVGENLVRKAIVPTLAVAGAYGAEDAVGTLMTINNALLQENGGGIIRMVRLRDKANQIHTHAVEAYLFRNTPTITTGFVDNSPFTIDDTDIDLHLDTLSFTAGVNTTLGKSSANQYITVRNINSYYLCASPTNVITVALKTAGTPTWADGDLGLEFWICRF